MTAQQLSLEAGLDLPQAFVDRWRELGGPSFSGEGCTFAHGRWWFVVRVAGAGKFAFLYREDPRACAEELIGMVTT